MEAKPRTVVLVEDNFMLSMMIEPVLQRLGYATRTLMGTGDAAAQVAALAPAIVLINLTSTRYAGPGLVRELKARPELTGVGIIGYAGHVERHFFEAGRAAGADLVVPNSAMRKALPEVLEKLQRRLTGTDDPEWPVEL